MTKINGTSDGSGERHAAMGIDSIDHRGVPFDCPTGKHPLGFGFDCPEPRCLAHGITFEVNPLKAFPPSERSQVAENVVDPIRRAVAPILSENARLEAELRASAPRSEEIKWRRRAIAMIEERDEWRRRAKTMGWVDLEVFGDLSEVEKRVAARHAATELPGVAGRDDAGRDDAGRDDAEFFPASFRGVPFLMERSDDERDRLSGYGFREFCRDTWIELRPLAWMLVAAAVVVAGALAWWRF